MKINESKFEKKEKGKSTDHCSMATPKCCTRVGLSWIISSFLDTSERRAAHLKAKIPVIRSKDMTLRLCRALRDNLLVTEALTCIELQGLPLREKDLSCLVKVRHNFVIN